MRKKTRKDYERDFQKYLVSNKKIKLKTGRSLTVLGSEVILYKPMHVLTEGDLRFENLNARNCIGRIDLIIQYGGKKYVTEIKYTPFTVENFWAGIKCIAYSAYYNWQIELFGKGLYYPALMLPHKAIKLEHKIIAGKLKIQLFGIEKTEEGWKVEEI